LPCHGKNYSEFRDLTVSLSYLLLQDLDLRCEELIKEEFGAECNFDVNDAVKKLEKLGIVHRVNLNHFILMLKYILWLGTAVRYYAISN
jgi:hypothetical protein